MPVSQAAQRPAIVDQVRRYFEARHHVRRGICLLNAGGYDHAIEEFSYAQRLNPDSSQLEALLVRCHVGKGDYRAAAEETSKLIDADPDDITSRIRHAMLLWKQGDSAAAIASLRHSVQAAPDCAELHFQLGTLLAACGGQEEATLRFTQSLALDPRHAEAMVSLAMCYAAQQDPDRAHRLLQRAQQLRPRDARIGLLLALAMRTAGRPVNNPHPAAMPADAENEREPAVAEMARLIQSDPEYIDAFIAVPAQELRGELMAFLLAAVSRALQESPHCVALRHQYACLLDRSGAPEEAVEAFESALGADPRHVPSLIQQAKLLQRMDRHEEAVRRLKEALECGVSYADIHALLGDSYRALGRVERARAAYRRAIEINAEYHAARQSLAALPA